MTEVKPRLGTTFQGIFGSVVAELRAARVPTVTQTEVADHMGLAVSTWSRIERGESALTLEQMVRIATFFGVPLSKLLQECETRLKGLQDQGVTVALSRDTLNETIGLVSLSSAQIKLIVGASALIPGLGPILGTAAAAAFLAYRSLKDVDKGK
ncbi:helix-turn-helix transcriptional regulator [Pseudomonas lundensis]|uniref:helix-turn-helix domain-containing protein n=1 Tax=Pseudomonas TaxID=286 RepID=UPI0006995D05|nr:MULTISPECIES: helix-turn-helix transcriptional regulator [Pseudomonas]NNA13705.1 helix-turn-helix transcriptional regulator [Pseudomonas lundensis]